MLIALLICGVRADESDEPSEVMLVGHPDADMTIARQQQQIPELNIVVHAMDEIEVWRTIQLTRRCARELNRMLHYNAFPQQKLHLMVMESEFAGAHFAIDEAPLEKNEDDDVRAMRILTALLRRHDQEHTGASNRKLRRSHANDFVAAAICNRLFYDGKGAGGVYLPDYRMARSQFERGFFPSCVTLLEEAVPPRPYLLFRLYAVHCDVLLRCAEESLAAEVFLPRLWTEEMLNNASLPVAFCRALGLSQYDDDALQRWYTTRAPSIVRLGINTMDREDAEAAVRRLVSVPVLDPAAEMGIRYIPLEELPNKLSDYNLDYNALSAMMRELLNYQNSAPPLLRDAIGQYYQAVAALRDGRTRDFRRQIATAHQSFAAALARQNRTSQLLDEVIANDKNEADLVRNFVWRTILEELEDNLNTFGVAK